MPRSQRCKQDDVVGDVSLKNNNRCRVLPRCGSSFPTNASTSTHLEARRRRYRYFDVTQRLLTTKGDQGNANCWDSAKCVTVTSIKSLPFPDCAANRIRVINPPSSDPYSPLRTGNSSAPVGKANNRLLHSTCVCVCVFVFVYVCVGVSGCVCVCVCV